MTDVLLPVLGSGIVNGASLALAAVGFTMIYAASRTVNFAHGEMILIGPYVVWMLLTENGWSYPAAAVVGLLAGVALGVTAERVVIAPFRTRPLLIQVMGVLAFAQVVQGVLRNTIGAQPRNVPAYASPAKIIPGLNLSTMDLIIIGSTLILVVGIAFFLYGTSLGNRALAVADNALGASLVGINTRMVAMIAWGLGGGAAALAGILIIPKQILDLPTGFHLTLNAFAAVVLGGFGSLTGAVVGGLIIGIAQALVAQRFGGGYESVVTLLIMLAVLSVRPQGLVGERA